nr:MAG TPA: hypothetical protein [Caudoviricetes sp.]
MDDRTWSSTRFPNHHFSSLLSMRRRYWAHLLAPKGHTGTNSL